MSLPRWRRWLNTIAQPEPRPPVAPRPRRRARLRLEALEARQAPAITAAVFGDVLTIVSDNTGNTITLDHNPVTGFTTVNGLTFNDLQFTRVEIRGGSGLDTDNLLATPARPTTVSNRAVAVVNIGKAGSIGGILDVVRLVNPPNHNTLTVDSSADTVNLPVTLSSFTPPGDTAFGRITGPASGAIEYRYADTTAVTVKTGRAAGTVNVLGTGVPTTLVGNAPATVNVGNADGVREIRGSLTVTNPPHFTTLNVNSAAAGGSRFVTMGVSGGVGFINGLAPAPIRYNQADVRAVTVTDGSGFDDYHITDTATNLTDPLTTLNIASNFGGAAVFIDATSAPLTVNGAKGGIDVGAPTGGVRDIRGALTVNNSSTTTMHDTGGLTGRDVVINDTSVVGLAPAVINYHATPLRLDTEGASSISVTVNGNSGSGSGGTQISLGPGGGAVNVRGTTGPVSAFSIGPTTYTVGSLAPALGGTLANIRGPVMIHHTNPTAGGTVFVDDSGDAGGHAVTFGAGGFGTEITGLGPVPIRLDTAGSVPVTVNGGRGGNVFGIVDSPPGLLALNTGTGDDTVALQSTRGPVTVNGQAGRDRVSLSGSGRGTADLRGFVSVTNAGGFTALTVDDTANPFAGYTTLSFGTGLGFVYGLGNPASSPFALQYATNDVSSLTLNGSSHNNRYFVEGTAPGIPVTVHAGSGNDTIVVGDNDSTLDSIRGPLTVDGQGGSDTLTINDQGEAVLHFYTVSPTQVARSPGGPTITYSAIEHLNLLPGRHQGTGPTNNVIDVQGTAPETAVEIDAGGGAVVNVGNEAGTLDDLQAPLTVTGDDGSLTLNVNDQGSGGAQVYALADGTVDRSGAATISYTGVGALALNAGQGGNRIDVEGLGPGTPAVVTAGAGGDLIRMRGGPVNAPLTLHGQGNTRLGYVAYTTPVFVDVVSGVATDVKGGFSGLSGITGGQDLNILVGDGQEDLTAVPGSRNLLISGGGTGTLTGGGVGDLLIGGSTAYDRDPDALSALLAEWARTDEDYATRVSNLTQGIGVPVLDATTVFDNGAQNTLVGHPTGGELNLYYQAIRKAKTSVSSIE